MAYEPNEFGYKDGLPSGDPDKVIKGSDFDVEFNAIKEALDSVDVDVNVDDVNGLEELLSNKADQSDLDGLSAELQQEITDREAADVVLQGNINNNQSQIDDVSGALSQEIRDRKAGDTALEDRIDGLVTDDLADVNSEGARLDQFLIYNGSQWVAEDFHIDTELTYQGGISVVSDSAPSAKNGDLYINNEGGVVGSSWTGIAGKTITPAVAVGWSEKNARWYMLGDIASAAVMRVEAGLGIDVDDTKPAEPVVSIDRTEVDKWYAPLWQQNGSDIYYNDGKVGIGAAAPFNRLDIQSSPTDSLATSESQLALRNTNPNRATYFTFDEDSNLTIYNTGSGTGGGDTIFHQASGEAVRIAKDGNVGIGTESPAAYGRLSLIQTEDSGVGGLAIVDSTYTQSLKLWCEADKAHIFSGNSGQKDLAINAGGGKVGIGGEPGTRTAADYIDQAKAKIKSWTAAIKTKLDEEPKANKKAVTLEVTDDAFEVIPTEDLVAERMAERAIGGGDAKLQVDGAGYFSGYIAAQGLECPGYVYRPNNAGITFGTNIIYPISSANAVSNGSVDLGATANRFKDAHFSGTVNSDGGYFSGNLHAMGVVQANQYLNINNNGFIRGEYAGELRFQGGAGGFTFYNNQNNTELANLSNVGNLTVNGTIYGTVDDVPSHVKAITPTQIANWDSGTGPDGGGATTDGRITDTQITNWDHAYVWGNHATAGYQAAGNYADANHNHSGVYQPAGNYETAGTAYTKAESDGRYELKGQGGGGLPAGDWACSGSITATGNITAYYSSDERLKDDITAMPVGLIDSIEPVTWKWKENGKDSGGVVAQQLQACGLDDWVNEAPNGDLGVDYNALIGMLIAEVKSLKQEIAAMK